MDLVLAVDVGTTNIKAGVVSDSGGVLRLSQRELTVEGGEDGRAEHDPEALYHAFIEVCREAAFGYEGRIVLLALSTYQLGMLPADRGGRPLMGMMTLLDTRPQATYARLLGRIDIADLYVRTGCPAFFHYPFSKIFWLKTQKPDLFQKVGCFLGSKEFFIRRLTGHLCTEASLATATQLMNTKTLQWDDYPLDTLGLTRAQLAEPVPSDKILGTLTDEASGALGLRRGTALLPGVYDGGAVGIGIGAMEEGTGIINIGTTGMLRVVDARPTLDFSPDMRLQTYYLTGGRWFPGAGVNNAGVVLKWLRDSVFGLSYDALTDAARSVPDAANLFFLPFLSGERNPQIGNVASGVFFGLRGRHTKGHMARAAMEGVSFALRLVLEALQDNRVPMERIRVGGGGARSAFWMETMASALGVPLQVTRVEETALIGSAMMGFVALGRFHDLQEATREMVQVGHLYLPDAAQAEACGQRFEFFKYLIHHLADAYRKHSELDG
ncbi:MAG: gluconokinase [Armatimonadetes bacterium]|nr:gluconokinase [Armatimonadota bacterium]